MRRHRQLPGLLASGLGLILVACTDPPPRVPNGLIHHYDFSGDGTIVFDRVGNRNGLIKGGGQLSGDGCVRLDGDNDYVDLPNSLISPHPEMSLEFVLRLDEPRGRYARAFSFGSSDLGEIHEAGGRGGEGVTFLNLTFQIEERVEQELGFRIGKEKNKKAPNRRTLKQGRVHHLVVTLDDPNHEILLYVDGERAGRIDTEGMSHQNLDDVNNWLGRSQWTNDQTPSASYFDLKIFNRVMGPEEIMEGHQQGGWRPTLGVLN